MHNLRLAFARRQQALAQQQPPPDVEAAQHQMAIPQWRSPQCGALLVEMQDKDSAINKCSRYQGI